MIELRNFQKILERDVWAQWDLKCQNVMPVAATGSGKTVVLSKFMHDESGASVAIAHRQELVSQISVALARNGVRHRLVGARKGSPLTRIISGLHVAELGYSLLDPNARAGVGGVDTVIKMDASDRWFQQVRLMVQDEAHHVLQGNKWGRAAQMFPHARGLLPTATPIRADGKGLGRHADGLVDAMVFAPTMREIIDMGFLTDYRIFAPMSNIDLSAVATSGSTGDFNAVQLRDAVHRSQIVGDVVQHYLRIARGKLGVTFAVDVESAAEIAAAFNAASIPAAVVSAKTPDTERAAVLRKFKNREILQLVNVDLFGEGFDLPAIEVVSFARPTESFALYCQQFGRALRLMLDARAASVHNNLTNDQRRYAIAASAKAVAIIIDHVGNVLRHGLPDAFREWSLNRRDRVSKSTDTMPLRTCLNVTCLQVYERYLKECPHCGHYPEPAGRSSPEQVDGDLTELDAATLAKMRGEIARVDGAPRIPQGATPEVVGAIHRRHWERQQSQAALREAVAWWAGMEASHGYSESASYRRFYFKFGVDVAGAQTLGSREASELAEKISTELRKKGVALVNNSL
jgi:superfamily II DNA or RNA helicase